MTAVPTSVLADASSRAALTGAAIEQQLLSTRDRDLRSILDNIRDAVSVKGLDRRYRLANQAFESANGLLAGAIDGQRDDAILPAFGQQARKAGIAQSMGSKGDCFDNAVAESFFATLKKELIHRQAWPAKAELRKRPRSPNHPVSTGAGEVHAGHRAQTTERRPRIDRRRDPCRRQQNPTPAHAA